MKIEQAGVVAILRRLPESTLLDVAGALVSGGIQVLEMTLDSPGAYTGISTLRNTYGDNVLIGAGTVMTREQLRGAKDAGAKFMLSPHLDTDLVAYAKELDVVLIPGIATPSEIALAKRAGAEVLKLFPAGPLGTSYLKDLLGPFHGTSFIPTGGITPANARDFIEAGAVAVGMGSSLVPKQDIFSAAWKSIGDRAEQVVRAVSEARGKN